MGRKKVIPVIEDKLQIVELDMAGAFPFSISVVYKKGVSIEEMIHEAAKEDDNLVPLSNDTYEEDGTSLSLVYKHSGTTVAYIFIDDSITQDTLVHESFHIVCRLFEVIGSVMDNSTEEFAAYLLSHVFRMVYKVITNTFQLIPNVIYNEE